MTAKQMRVDYYGDNDSRTHDEYEVKLMEEYSDQKNRELQEELDKVKSLKDLLNDECDNHIMKIGSMAVDYKKLESAADEMHEVSECLLRHWALQNRYDKMYANGVKQILSQYKQLTKE